MATILPHETVERHQKTRFYTPLHRYTVTLCGLKADVDDPIEGRTKLLGQINAMVQEMEPPTIVTWKGKTQVVYRGVDGFCTAPVKAEQQTVAQATFVFGQRSYPTRNAAVAAILYMLFQDQWEPGDVPPDELKALQCAHDLYDDAVRWGIWQGWALVAHNVGCTADECYCFADSMTGKHAVTPKGPSAFTNRVKELLALHNFQWEK